MNFLITVLAETTPRVMHAGIEVLVLGALFVGAAAVAYDGYQKAKKAARDAAGRSRGILYQTRATAMPRRIIFGQTRVGGIELYVTTSGTDNEYLHYIFGWGEGPCNNVFKIFFDGEEVTFSGNDATGDYAGLVHHQFAYGHVPQDAIADAVTNVPSWQSSDRLYGICHSWMQLKYDEAGFPNGVPDISALITGYANVFDPRAPSKGYSNNPALCWATYMALDKIGPGVLFFEEIDQEDLIAAANVCEESVALTVGGNEDRYTFDGVIELDRNVEEVIGMFRTAMAGTITYVGGRWRVFAGAYITPTFTIDDSMLVAPVKQKTIQSRRERINTVRGLYTNSENNYFPTDFPPYSDEDYISADGEILFDDLALMNNHSFSMCRRIAKIHLLRSRFSKQILIECNIEALRTHPGLPVFFDHSRLGFDQTPMEVLTWDMIIEDNNVRISMTLRLTDSSIFTWDASEDRTDDAALPGVNGVSSPSSGFGGNPDNIVGGLSYGEI